MNKNVISCKENEFVPGRTLRATVKAVNKTGVMIKMPGGHGSGVISPRCWGTGIEREKALAEIRPGDEFDVVVCNYDARTMTMSLVLVGCEHLKPLPGKELKKMVRYVAQPTDLITDSPASYRRPDAPSGRETILALGAEMLAKGAEKKAIACFAKAAKTNPLVWADLAWMYHDGTAVKADKSKARRFFRKARERAAKDRQCKIRRARARLRKNRLFGLVTLRGCAA